MNRIIFFIILYLMSSNLQGQELDKIQSLLKKLAVQKNDTIKAQILDDIGFRYGLEKDSVNCFYHSNKSLALAKKIKFWEGMIQVYNTQSNYYIAAGNQKKCYESLNKMFLLAKSTGNKKVLGLAHLNYGFFLAEDPEKNHLTLTNFKKALKLFELSKDDKNKKTALLAIADQYVILTNYNEALAYYNKCLNIGDEKNNSGVYFGIGEIYTKLKKYDQAIIYLEKAILPIEKENRTDQPFYGVLARLLGDNYLKVKKYDKSRIAYNKAEENFKKNGIYGLISVKINKIKLDYILHNEKDESAIIEVRKLIDQLNNCDMKSRAYIELAQEFQDRKEYAQSLDYLLDTYKKCYDVNKHSNIMIDLDTKLGFNYLMLAKNTQQIVAKHKFPNNRQKLLHSSLNHYQKAINQLKVGPNYNDLQSNYYNLSLVYELLENNAKAYEAYKLYAIYSDSLATVENRELLVQNQMQFEFDQKEKLQKAEQAKKDAMTNASLEKEKNNRNIALGGIGFFIVVAGFSGMAYVQKRKDNKIISSEKQKSDDLLLNILPAEIAKELKEKGTSEAKHFDSVSIMFTDFKDFTKLSEKIPSTELIQELNYCFKEFDNIITKHGVEKIKTIGDSYMAVCGLPAKHGNHAQKMVDAALEIRDFIENYKQQRQNEGKSFFEMRIGINSGEVVAGIVGIKKFAYDIWGDAVNTASRMESNGVIGKVNISEATYKLVDNDFSFEHRGEIDAKGKGKINMYFVEPKNGNV